MTQVFTQFKITSDDSMSNNLIKNFKAYRIGIQAEPGAQFIFNSNEATTNNIITIGRTGIYELDLTNTPAAITSIYLSYRPTKGLAYYIDAVGEGSV